MALKTWIQNGKLVVNDSGYPILCETCPCVEDCDSLIVPLNQRLIASGITGISALTSPLSFADALQFTNRIAHKFVQYPLASSPFASTFANMPPVNYLGTQTNPFCYDTETDGGAVPGTVTTCEELATWIKNLRYVYIGDSSYAANSLRAKLETSPNTTPTGTCRRTGVYASQDSSTTSFADALSNLPTWCDYSQNANTQLATLRDELLWYASLQRMTKRFVSGVLDRTTYYLAEQEESYLLYIANDLAAQDNLVSAAWTWDWPEGCVQWWLQPGDVDIISQTLYNYNSEFSNRGSFSLYDSYAFGSTDSVRTSAGNEFPTTVLGWGQPCAREFEAAGDLVLYDTIVDGDTTTEYYGIDGVGNSWRYQYVEYARGIMAVHFADIPDGEWSETCSGASCAYPYGSQ